MEDWHLSRLDDMKKLIIFFIYTFIISSCIDLTKRLDDEFLGVVKKNELYSNIIELPGNQVNELTFRVNIEPVESGIKWEANNGKFFRTRTAKKDYGSITIEGKPNNIGNIYINFYWSTYGTNISTGRKFQKRYILKVEE
ncbi:hypothetical protein [Aggregatibacter actinomycetemcomitans]|uniref:hypothetical protein n=1 Tax=Aggregatibacter actinomycetemcomitans TaxID=714 RepID=UPI00215136AE|nr:hypothetical protein [Aggregatibacter actinomycetemcomitans]